jgi:hypothetical protein
MSENIVIPQETDKRITRAEAWANALVIKTPEQDAEASQNIKALKTIKNSIMEFFRPSKESAAATHKAIVANEKLFTDKLDGVERIAKQKILAYREEQERIRLAEQARLQAEADEKARREREALEKKAAKYKTEEKKQAALEQAAMVTAPVVNVESKIQDTASSIRKTWKGEVVDKVALIQAAATGNAVALSMIEINEAAVNSFARSCKGQIAVAGVKFFEEKSLSTRV